MRQPLAEAVVRVRTAAEGERLLRYADTIADELNVKAVRVAGEEAGLVGYQVKPNPALLGKRYGGLFPKIRAAALALSSELGPGLRAGQPATLTVDGQEVTLQPDEVEVQLVEKEGYSVTEDGGYVVAVSTTVGDELRREGLAREVVRRIQVMRKDADLRIEEPIVTYYEAAGELARVMQEWAAYIGQETLSRELVAAAAPEGAYVERQRVDGQEVTLGIQPADGR